MNDEVSTVQPPGPTATQLIQAHQTDIWRYLRYLGAETSEVEDLVQETFLTLLRSDFEHRDTAQTRGYLRTVARRQLLMLRRRQGRRVPEVELQLAEQVWVDHQRNHPCWDEMLVSLEACLKRLAGRARQAIDLHYRQGCGRQEIGRQLGIGGDGVKSLLRRARLSLRNCLQIKVKS